MELSADYSCEHSSKSHLVMSCLDRGVSDEVGGVPLLAAQATVDYSMLVLMVAGNAFIVVSVVRFRRQYPFNGTAVSTRFAANLALADAYVGVATSYFLAFRYFCCVQQLLGSHWFTCVVRYFFMSSAHLTSACSLGAIAVDRYVAVVHALRYREIMSSRRCAVLLICVWVCSFSVASPIFFWNNYKDGVICELETVVPVEYVTALGMVTHSSIIIIVAVVHYRVHREAMAVKKRRRSDESQQAISAVHGHAPATRAINTKSARVVLYVTGVYVTCWTPYSILYVIKSMGYASPVINVTHRLCLSFADLNYLINPFLYSWKNTAVKNSLISACKCLGEHKEQKTLSCRKHSHSPISSAVSSRTSVHIVL